MTTSPRTNVWGFHRRAATAYPTHNYFENRNAKRSASTSAKRRRTTLPATVDNSMIVYQQPSTWAASLETKSLGSIKESCPRIASCSFDFPRFLLHLPPFHQNIIISVSVCAQAILHDLSFSEEKVYRCRSLVGKTRGCVPKCHGDVFYVSGL